MWHRAHHQRGLVITREDTDHYASAMRRRAAPRSHKQIHLDRIAWSKGARYADCRGGREKMNYLRDTCQRRSPRSTPPPTSPFTHTHQIPVATVAFHLPPLVCTRAARQPPNVFIYSEPLGEITVSCCPFFFPPSPPLSSPAVQMEFA